MSKWLLLKGNLSDMKESRRELEKTGCEILQSGYNDAGLFYVVKDVDDQKLEKISRMIKLN